MTPVSSMAFVKKQYWGRHIEIQTFQYSHTWIAGSLCLIIAWHQVAWLLDFNASSFRIRAVLLVMSIAVAIRAIIGVCSSLSQSSLTTAFRSVVVIAISSLPVAFRWVVPDISPDSNSIHYPLALQVFADVNLFKIQIGPLAAERIDLGVGLHILAASTMELFGTKWNFEIVNSFALAIALCSLLRVCVSLRIRSPLVVSLASLGSVPLVAQQFRLGYQDFFPTCIYLALAVESLNIAISKQVHQSQTVQYCLVLSVLAVISRTTFLVMVLPLLLFALYVNRRTSTPVPRRSCGFRASQAVGVGVSLALLAIVPGWVIAAKALAGETPKLLQADVQREYWSGASSWTTGLSKVDGVALSLVGETARNPDEVTISGMFNIPSQQEVSDSGYPDTRVAGGGPFLGEVYLFSILAMFSMVVLVWGQIANRRLMQRVLLLLGLIGLPILVLPFNFNYRYFPSYSILPVIALLALCFISASVSRTLWRLVTKVLLALAGASLWLNTYVVGLGVLDAMRTDAALVHRLETELQNQQTFFFASTRFGLNRHFGVDLLKLNDPRLTNQQDDDQWLTDCPSERRVLIIDSEWGVCRLP